MSLKDLITRANDKKIKAVEVPEWETTVYLKTIDVEERLKLFDLLGKSKAEYPAKVLLYTLCEADGTLVFSEKDFSILKTKNAAVIDRLAMEASRLNGLIDAEDEKKD